MKKFITPPPPGIRQFLKGAVLIAFTAMLIVSCKKTNNVDVSNNTVSPVLNVKDGVIAFATASDFKAAMDYYHLKPIEVLQTDVKNLSGFTALIAKIPSQVNTVASTQAMVLEENPTPTEEELFYEDSLVQDPYVQSIMNDKREISIEGYILRVTEKGVFAYLPTQRINFETAYPTDQFNTNLAGKFTNDDINVQQDLQEIVPNTFLVFRQPIEVATPPVVSRPGGCNGTTLGSNLFGQISDCNDTIDNRRRIRYTTYSQNLGFYSSIGFKTRRQTRFLKVWWLAKAQNISCEGEGSYESKWPTTTLTTYTYNRLSTRRERLDNSKAESVMSWHTGQIGTKLGSNGPKPTFKLAQKYKYQKHTSDHTARNNNVNYSKRMIHN